MGAKGQRCEVRKAARRVGRMSARRCEEGLREGKPALTIVGRPADKKEQPNWREDHDPEGGNRSL